MPTQVNSDSHFHAKDLTFCLIIALTAIVNIWGLKTGSCRGDIVAVLPRLELAAVDVVVAHAFAKSYAAEAAKTSGWTAARAERTKRTRFRKYVSDYVAFRFVPFAVEACGYIGGDVRGPP